MKISKKSIAPIDFDGLRIFDFTSNGEYSSSIAEIIVPPGARHKVSWSNRSDKYYYIITGSLEFRVDDQQYSLESGDTCIIRQGQRFSYSNTTTEESRLILFHTPSFCLDSEVFED
jgi:mannose-6-phosphate isomerase-like protein (cupin superfamily)